MKKSKIIVLVFFSVLLLMFGFNAVKAEEIMTDEDCKACAERYGGRCGFCRACAERNGECVVNQHDKELWDEGKDNSNDVNENQNNSNSNNTVPPEDPDKQYELENQIDKVYCGSKEQGRVKGIPKKLPELTSTAITVIQIAVPIILIILGMLDLFKGITASKEDEIKKGQQIFVKRLVVAAIIFLVVVIVKFLVSVIADTNKTNIADCIDCFISNDCEEE